MKAIISTKYLAGILNEIDIDANNAIRMQEVPRGINVLFGDDIVEINCEVTKRGFHAIKDQESARWDWIKKIVNQVDEQPAVLTISKNSIAIEFQC
jgi:hypothetical protein